jgi:RND superfamily putative drug exporter
MREAIAVAAPAASRAITVAGLTLAATFALLAIVPLRPFRELALLMTIGVLVDALVVRTVLIPSLLAVFGRASWWPGSPQRPPSTTAFLERVSARTGYGDGQAWEATRATLATLAERIPARESREVARQLPDGLRESLRRAEGSCEPFGCDEFVDRVARRARVSRPQAREDARAVIATLLEALPPTEVDYVRAALSDDYRGLFGDAVDVPAERFERVPAVR